MYRNARRNPITTKEEAMKVVGNDRTTFRLCSPELRSDVDVALEAIRRWDGQNMSYVSDSLLNSEKFIRQVLTSRRKKVVSADSEFIGYATSWPVGSWMISSFADKRFLVEIYQEYRFLKGEVLSRVKEALKDDRELVLLLVNQSGSNYRSASDRLKLDREIALAAVRSSASILLSVPQPLQSDFEVVLEAVSAGGTRGTTCALQYIPKEFRENKDLISRAVAANSFALRDCSKEFKNDKDVVSIAVKRFGDALQFASEQMRNDKDVVLSAVKKSGNALRFASDEMRNDEQVVLAALQNIVGAIRYAGKRLLSEKKFVLDVAKQTTISKEKLIKECSESLRLDHGFIMELEAIYAGQR